MSSRHLTDQIKAEAKRLGFFACGVAKAEKVDETECKTLTKWIDAGSYADMDYMRNHTEKRLDPTLLLPGTKSIISVALNYSPAMVLPSSEYQLAVYALGRDYHDIMRERLKKLGQSLGWEELAYGADFTTKDDNSNTVHYRVFCDTAPVLERYWAQKAGLGWVGRNHQLIIPHAGTMFFLGEIFTNQELCYDAPARNRCGNCDRCVTACPTQALSTTPFDASLCLSYQLIENRGELSEKAKSAMGNTIYGCDECQRACPWNRYAQPTTDPELQARPELLDMTKKDWNELTEDEYRKLFKGSAVKRIKYKGLMRNIRAAQSNEKEDK